MLTQHDQEKNQPALRRLIQLYEKALGDRDYQNAEWIHDAIQREVRSRPAGSPQYELSTHS